MIDWILAIAAAVFIVFGIAIAAGVFADRRRVCYFCRQRLTKPLIYCGNMGGGYGGARYAHARCYNRWLEREVGPFERGERARYSQERLRAGRLE